MTELKLQLCPQQLSLLQTLAQTRDYAKASEGNLRRNRIYWNTPTGRNADKNRGRYELDEVIARVGALRAFVRERCRVLRLDPALPLAVTVCEMAYISRADDITEGGSLSVLGGLAGVAGKATAQPRLMASFGICQIKPSTAMQALEWARGAGIAAPQQSSDCR